jgi:hypothetical protein
MENSVPASRFRPTFRFRGIDDCKTLRLKTKEEEGPGSMPGSDVRAVQGEESVVGLGEYRLFPVDGPDCQ